LTHRFVVFITAGAKYNSFLAAEINWFAVLSSDDSDNFTLCILQETAGRCLIVNLDIVALFFNTFFKAAPESLTGTSFFLRTINRFLVEVLHAFLIGCTISIVFAFFSAGEIREGSLIESGLAAADESRVQALQEFKVCRREVCPELSQTF